MKNKKVLLILGGCLGLILLCCCAFLALGFLAPSFTGSFVESSAAGPDSSFTRFKSKEEIDKAQDDYTGEIFSAALESTSQSEGSYSAEFSEEEVLSAFFGDTTNLDEKYVDDIGLDLSDGQMRLQISMDMLANYDAFNNTDANGEAEDFTCKTLDDLNIDITELELYPTMTFEIVDNINMSVKDISFGSPLIDAWCKDEIKDEIDSAFDNQLQSSTQEDDGTKIEFKEDMMVMTFPMTPSNQTSPAGGEDTPLDTDFDLDEYLDSIKELQDLQQ